MNFQVVNPLGLPVEDLCRACGRRLVRVERMTLGHASDCDRMSKAPERRRTVRAAGRRIEAAP